MFFSSSIKNTSLKETSCIRNVQKKRYKPWYLYVDMNSFFASVEQQERGLEGKPVVVVPTVTDSTCAIAVSYEAKHYGIKTGTKIYEAKKMCPNLICIPARHMIYTYYHNKIIDSINTVVPVERVCSIDEVVCRLTHEQCCNDSAYAIAMLIKKKIRQDIGSVVTCSIGISCNQFLAKVATNIEKKDGLVFLHYNELPGRLLDLRISNFPGIGKKIENRLNHHGIYTVSQLWNLNQVSSVECGVVFMESVFGICYMVGVSPTLQHIAQ